MLSFRSQWPVLFVIFAAALLCSAQDGPAKPIRKCRRAWLGASAPDLRAPQDVVNKLRRKANFRLLWFHRKVSSYFSTPLKRLGILGWTDYCTEACAEGAVVHADRSGHGFYTVDLLLNDFVVAGERPEWQEPRFLRVEVHGQAKKNAERLPKKGEIARLCDKLMWDGDGFLEIHPRTAADLQPPELRAGAAKAGKETAPEH